MDRDQDDPPPGRRGKSSAGDVHVWLLAAPEEADDARATRALALLDGDERARLSRLRDRADARRYLLAHALARTTLSRYAPEVPPEGWRFRIGAHGRPEIADGPAALRFNLSHTAGLVACAVAHGGDVDIGVDVEHLYPRGWGDEACLEIAAAHFAPAEVAALAAAPPDARRGLFFELWTLKEAYAKARGFGLALPLASFSFEPRSPRAPEVRVRCAPDVDEDPDGWRFEHLRPTPRHALAVAARCAPGETLSVRICEAESDSP